MESPRRIQRTREASREDAIASTRQFFASVNEQNRVTTMELPVETSADTSGENTMNLNIPVNMARKTTVMNVDVDDEDELNLIKDARARSDACYKCGEVGHFQRDCKYDAEINPQIFNRWQEGQASFDSYDPVVGKWMTNLVATTPITAKAM